MSEPSSPKRPPAYTVCISRSGSINRTPDSVASLVQRVDVNHGRADIFVSHQFLNRADVVSGFQQVCGEGMPDGMAADMLDHSGFSNGLLDRPLKDCLVRMVAPFFPSFRVLPPVLLGKDRTETSMAGEDFPLPWVLTASSVGSTSTGVPGKRLSSMPSVS